MKNNSSENCGYDIQNTYSGSSGQKKWSLPALSSNMTLKQAVQKVSPFSGNSLGMKSPLGEYILSQS